MDILFARSESRADKTLVTRKDGVRISVPVFGPLAPIPHDLAHYVVEREMELPDGLWGSVAAGAIFSGMAVLDGRQPPHARERSHAIQSANYAGVGLSELLVGATLAALHGGRVGDLPRHILSLLGTTRAERDSLTARLLPAVEVMIARWQAIPMGGTLLVEWPDALRCAYTMSRRHHDRPPVRSRSGKVS